MERDRLGIAAAGGIVPTSFGDTIAQDNVQIFRTFRIAGFL